METERLEKQFQMWIYFLFFILGSSITLVFVSFGNIAYRTEWPGFGNYMGGVWSSVQLLAVASGFHLLAAKRWKSIPLAGRINTGFGYFLAGWFALLAFGFMLETPPATDYYFLLVGSGLLIVLAYIWALKRTFALKEEIFP